MFHVEHLQKKQQIIDKNFYVILNVFLYLVLNKIYFIMFHVKHYEMNTNKIE